MRKIYVALAGVLMLAVLAQFYFAAVGAFAKPQDDSSYALHGMTGMMIIPVLSLLATLAAAASRAPGRQIALTLLPLGLVIVQVLIIVLGRALNDATGNTTPVGLAILGLHAINGMAVIGAAGMVLRQARTLAASSGTPVASAGPVGDESGARASGSLGSDSAARPSGSPGNDSAARSS
ncbi:DUF6220 domain-containing protein [Sphaerisporangium perillae]|uniref:DUF6220 domain-containing protein n=1 Tax=Sphaerisporangium perillae TaxID=2935860 RepID=UPI002010A9D7|nr:DUF6220 domain-containing protein [Sphaerisporangium perillae]